MLLPSKLQAGQPFKDSIVRTINQIIDFLRANRIVSDGKTIRVNQTAGGITLSATASPASGTVNITNTTNEFTSGGVVTCVITGSSAYATSNNGVFTAIAYPNGLGTTPSFNVNLVFGDYALSTRLPTGSIVVANAISLQVIGGD